MKHLNFKSKGFTLFELLVTAAVILILTSFILANYPSAGREFALKRSTNKLAQDIWQVQSKAIAMEMRKANGSTTKGYGIYLQLAPPAATYEYKLFAKIKTDNWQYQPPEFLEREVSLESGVEIGDLEAGGDSDISHLSIVFQPPDPIVWINNSSSSSSTITLRLTTDHIKTGTIFINSAGLITTQ